MQAVVDFLLEYYVWILVVLVILLITVVGFLADTKKKKRMREKVNSEGDNTNNYGVDNNLPPVNDFGAMNNTYNNPQMDNSFGNNSYNQNMMNDGVYNNSINTMNNNMNSFDNNMNMGMNNNFFNNTPEVNNFEPRPVEATPIMNNSNVGVLPYGVNNVETPVNAPVNNMQNVMPGVNANPLGPMPNVNPVPVMDTPVQAPVNNMMPNQVNNVVPNTNVVNTPEVNNTMNAMPQSVAPGVVQTPSPMPNVNIT